MKVKDLKEQLNLLDEDLEIFHNESILGTIFPLPEYKVIKRTLIQLKSGVWYSKSEFNELKESGEIFDSDILIEKEVAYLLYDEFDIDDITDTEYLDI